MIEMGKNTRLLDHLNGKLFIIVGLKLEKLEGQIQYADVSFSYPSRPTVCLRHSFNMDNNNLFRCLMNTKLEG